MVGTIAKIAGYVKKIYNFLRKKKMESKIEQIQEILFQLMEGIISLKEDKCKNSGWNWQDKIKPLIDKLDD